MFSALPFAPAGPHGVDPLILLSMALLADAIFVAPGFLFRLVRHPLAVVADAVAWLERKLNREQRSEGTRAWRGLLALVVVAGGATLAGLAVAWLSRNHPFGWIVEFPMVIMLLSQRSLHDRVRAVANALDESLEAGRRAIANLAGRDPEQLDRPGVARAALESLAEDFGAGAVAPVFWYVLFGLPGLLAYKAVNTMNAMVGHATPSHRAYGRWTARADTALNFFPARFAGLFLVLAAPVAGRAHAKFWPALAIMLRDSSKHRSANAGWPVAALAGALGLALAGPRRYREVVADDPWIGNGTAEASAADIRRALRLYVAACALNAAAVVALAPIR
ncbi:MAG: cobalamin biosynthesis protein [Rhodospirillales bacterium]|nr:cobalamin biosynthesis protein [Rhodospirillales bacterium]MSP81331.1 cobalamin biosynthesis protein [Rhodospirillales bacterium]